MQEDTNKLYADCREDLFAIKKKILDASSKIKFNEDEHRYFYDGEECMPVSNVVDLFIPEKLILI